MSIVSINEIHNPDAKEIAPIKEVQNILIPDIIDKNIPNRNGFIYLLSGAGGSGKTSLLLNMFKSKSMYRNVFHNIYYICPEASFLSVANHPFKTHTDVYHEMSVNLLEEIYQELMTKKELAVKYIEYQKKKKTKKKPPKKEKELFIDDEEKSSDEEKEEVVEPHEIEYSCVIIDDMANTLKEISIQTQLSKMIIKARHICCAFVFTLQAYNYMPKILRRQVTYITIFKPRNTEEFILLSHELLNMSKDDALTLFNYVFNENYNHLDVDTVSNIYYKNFNKLEFTRN
jgi:guanylate kinase